MKNIFKKVMSTKSKWGQNMYIVWAHQLERRFYVNLYLSFWYNI